LSLQPLLLLLLLLLLQGLANCGCHCCQQAIGGARRGHLQPLLLLLLLLQGLVNCCCRCRCCRAQTV
jgi:hypothetical protein